MKWLILTIMLGTSALAKLKTLDDDLEELKITNEKLSGLDIQTRKLDDFVTRIGHFYEYCKPMIDDATRKLGTEHVHEKDHSPTLIIENKIVAELEKFNEYLDWVINTDTMDAIK